MNEQQDVFDEYEKEIVNILRLVRHAQTSDGAGYVAKNLPPSHNVRLDAVAKTMFETDSRMFLDLLDAMKNIEKQENVRRGATYGRATYE